MTPRYSLENAVIRRETALTVIQDRTIAMAEQRVAERAERQAPASQAGRGCTNGEDSDDSMATSEVAVDDDRLKCPHCGDQVLAWKMMAAREAMSVCGVMTVRGFTGKRKTHKGVLAWFQ